MLEKKANPEELYLTSLLLIKKGKIKEAKMVTEELKQDPFYYNLAKGILYFFSDAYEVAVEHFLKAKSYKENDILLRFLAFSLFKMGKYKAALSFLLKIKEKELYDYFLLFLLYSHFGDVKEAREYLHLCYQIDGKRTLELLNRFYRSFIEPSLDYTEEEKKQILDIIRKLKFKM